MNTLHNESDLAEALDRALSERGRATSVLEHGVAELVELARTLEETAAHVGPSDEFRIRSRQRLVARMARSSRPQLSAKTSVADRARLWAARFVAGLAAVGLSGVAAAGASASSLPGDPLYPVKQVTETAALQLAPTQSARQVVLLHQADTRLDETADLLQQGRDSDAELTAARYGDTVAALPAPANSDAAQSQLGSDESRLNQLLQSAPARARPGLERALAAAEGHLKTAQAVPPPAQHDIVDPAPTSVAEPHESRRQEQRQRPEPTPIDTAVDTAPAADPPSAPPATSAAPQQGAPPPHPNVQREPAQSGHAAPQRSGAPRPARAGRGRP